MAATTVAITTPSKARHRAYRITIPCASNTFYPFGSIVCWLPGTDKYARIGADTSGFVFAGIVVGSDLTMGTDADNTTATGVGGGGAGVRSVIVESGHMIWMAGTFTVSGVDAEISDNQTLAVHATPANHIAVGMVVELETLRGTAGVWVITDHVMLIGA